MSVNRRARFASSEPGHSVLSEKHRNYDAHCHTDAAKRKNCVEAVCARIGDKKRKEGTEHAADKGSNNDWFVHDENS